MHHIGPSIQAGHGIVTDHNVLAMTPVRLVTYPSINWIHDCLTSIINWETLAHSY